MARNPKKKSRKPKSTKPRKRAPPRRATNQNTVRVHVVNTVGGEAPAPYTGPDRGYFAFNPVFDAGLPKQAVEPPMNLGGNIASGAVRRPIEISTQTEPEGIFADFMDRVNPSVGIGSGIKFEPGSPELQPTPPPYPKPEVRPRVKKSDMMTSPLPAVKVLRKEAKRLKIKGYTKYSQAELWERVNKTKQD